MTRGRGLNLGCGRAVPFFYFEVNGIPTHCYYYFYCSTVTTTGCECSITAILYFREGRCILRGSLCTFPIPGGTIYETLPQGIFAIFYFEAWFAPSTIGGWGPQKTHIKSRFSAPCWKWGAMLVRFAVLVKYSIFAIKSIYYY